MSYTFQNRKVDVTDKEFAHGEGASAIAACWEDTGTELTDAELDEFNETCGADLYQNAYEDAASDAYDRAKDMAKYGE